MTVICALCPGCHKVVLAVTTEGLDAETGQHIADMRDRGMRITARKNVGSRDWCAGSGECKPLVKEIQLELF